MVVTITITLNDLVFLQHLQPELDFRLLSFNTLAQAFSLVGPQRTNRKSHCLFAAYCTCVPSCSDLSGVGRVVLARTPRRAMSRRSAASGCLPGKTEVANTSLSHPPLPHLEQLLHHFQYFSFQNIFCLILPVWRKQVLYWACNLLKSLLHVAVTNISNARPHFTLLYANLT